MTTILDRAPSDRLPLRVLATDPRRIDRQLPPWARRSHPIVRTELGALRKVMTPDLRLPLRLVALQAVLIAITLPLPGLFNLLLPVVTVPVVLLPIVLYFYIESLVRVGIAAASSVAQDQRRGRFPLLRATPIPLREILTAKACGAIWRQAETLDLLMMSAAVLSLPLLILQYASQYPPAVYPIESRLLMVGGLLIAVVRVMIEAPMIAALGVLMGAVTGARIPAVLATGALGLAYFVLLNLPRLLPLDPAGRFLVELVLPVILPPAITYGSLLLAVRVLERD